MADVLPGVDWWKVARLGVWVLFVVLLIVFA